MTDKVQKIREEVESLREKIMGIRTDFADGQKSVLTELLVFIDSLQEEPVSEDLEKEVRKYAPIYYKDNDISKFARHFANWQKKQDQKSMEIMDEVYFKSCDMIRKQMIDKACKYLQDHREEVETEDNGISGWISDEFIEKFKKAIKDE